MDILSNLLNDLLVDKSTEGNRGSSMRVLLSHTTAVFSLTWTRVVVTGNPVGLRTHHGGEAVCTLEGRGSSWDLQSTHLVLKDTPLGLQAVGILPSGML